jgi:hypothetical protein
MSCGNCSHKLVCKYKPVSPCPIYPDDAALEECGTQSTDVQQLKPKMPSYEELDVYCKSIGVNGVQAANLFIYFAQHFGY